MVTATYSGDPTDDPMFAGSVGTLTKAVHAGPTTTTVTSSSEPSVTGQAVSFTALVAPTSPSTGTPTGSVTFSITAAGGVSLTCDDTGGATQPLSGTPGSDTAQCDLTDELMAADTPYTVSATYSGDDNYATSTGSTNQDVFRAIATISVVDSNPSSSLVAGQPVTFTATVTGITPPGSGTPMGSVVFSVVGNSTAGPNETCDTTGDTVSLAGTLSAQCTFARGLPSTPLSYTVSATLQDPNFKTPVVATLIQPISRNASTVTLDSVPESLVASQGFDFAVTVKSASPGLGGPTGYLEWSVCQNEEPCTTTYDGKGNTVLLPALTAADKTKNQNKVGISVPEGLAPGFYDVSATYEGDTERTSSTSSVAHILVGQVPTTVQVLENHNPVAFEGRLKITAAVVADARATESLGPPTGTVTFTITGASTGDTLTCTNPDATANVVTISTTAQNQAVASCLIPAGVLMSSDSPYSIKAVYSGDPNYLGQKGVDSETVDAVAG